MESVARSTTVGPAESSDLAELAAVASATFPLACPPSIGADDIASFVAANLSVDRFAEYLTDPRRVVLTAQQDGRIIGYAMLIRDDAGVELSKMYVSPRQHGAGVSTALMDAALAAAADWGASSMWLGVNQKNQRAQRFYTKSGFTVNGTRTFRVGSRTEHDYVMVRSVP